MGEDYIAENPSVNTILNSASHAQRVDRRDPNGDPALDRCSSKLGDTRLIIDYPRKALEDPGPWPKSCYGYIYMHFKMDDKHPGKTGEKWTPKIFDSKPNVNYETPFPDWT